MRGLSDWGAVKVCRLREIFGESAFDSKKHQQKTKKSHNSLKNPPSAAVFLLHAKPLDRYIAPPSLKSELANNSIDHPRVAEKIDGTAM
ncbi:hypothetical protein [Novipirellula artificiosorum]|uniref:hypothetical protein n=1 Tax=Novipirellula artificiosorum TaxID=2528016 RepID=UPI0011B838DD|nr:hypothetical protein [Novipirellula artificiosorum]